MTNNPTRRILAELLSRPDGTIAVYKEKMGICRVRIVDVHLDDVRVSARCETVETPGLNRGGASWNIAVPLRECSVTEGIWSGGYAGWQIFLDPKVIQKVLDIVAVLPAGKTYADDYTRAPAPANSKCAEIRSPGPCVRELYSYLHDQALYAGSRPATEGRDDSLDGKRLPGDKGASGHSDGQGTTAPRAAEATPSGAARRQRQPQMDMTGFIGLFEESDDLRVHRRQILGLRRAVISLAQDLHVLKQLLRETKVLDPARYRTLRTERMIRDHSGAGASPWVHYSYFPHFLSEEDYLRTQFAATEEEIQGYKSEVDFVSQLS